MPYATAPLTPGAYLKHRRTAAGLATLDVAELLTTDPTMPARERADYLDLIEADVQPARFDTLIALLGVFDFDLGVLGTLTLIQLGRDVAPPRLCRICSWSPGCDRPGAMRRTWAHGEDLCSEHDFTPATGARVEVFA